MRKVKNGEIWISSDVNHNLRKIRPKNQERKTPPANMNLKVESLLWNGAKRNRR